MPAVEERRDGPVSIVTLNRPEVHNAIDGETAELLRRAIERFAADPDAVVLVVTGAGGKAFSSGADLTDGPGLFTKALTGDGSGPLRFSALDPGKPTIAAVEGYCFAGGLELACWCDFRIAGDTSEFGVLNRRWGIPLVDGGTQRLARVVGLSNALWMTETGMRIDAQRARAIGLVQEVVPAGSALDRAVELGRRVAAYPRASLLADRASTLAGAGVPLADGLERELADGVRALADPELAEGLRRYAAHDRPDAPRPAD